MEWSCYGLIPCICRAWTMRADSNADTVCLREVMSVANWEVSEVTMESDRDSKVVMALLSLVRIAAVDFSKFSKLIKASFFNDRLDVSVSRQTEPLSSKALISEELPV